jgi:hypothetical protein
MNGIKHLDYSLVPDWPVLAWLARARKSDSRIRVFHGRDVEIADDWFCEAVWDGDFTEGGFDRTDIVAGSGGRLRDGGIRFISSGSTVDRLNSFEVGDTVWVSNSLACLLATLGINFDTVYPHYFYDFKSVIYGLQKYHRVLKTPGGPVQLTYFENLVWDGDTLSRSQKPGANRDFSTFFKYRAFLDTSLQSLSENMMSIRRRHRYSFLSCLSRGYDSPTVTSLARKFGCRESLCIAEENGNNEDNGEMIAGYLNVQPNIVRKNAWQSSTLPEVSFVGADAKGEDVVIKGAESFLARRVLLSGFHGDKVWAKNPDDLSENIVRGDQSGLDLTEYRLQVGFIHCPIPFWGVRQIRDINRISHSPEMRPWDVPGDYSRPICRRIVEEAGVPRDMFGSRKLVVAVLFNLSDQYLSPHSKEDYFEWLHRNRGEWVRNWRLPPLSYSSLDYWEQRGRKKLLSLCEGKRGLWRVHSYLDYAPTRLRRHVFPWAMEHLKKSYQSVLMNSSKLVTILLVGLLVELMVVSRSLAAQWDEQGWDATTLASLL